MMTTMIKENRVNVDTTFYNNKQFMCDTNQKNLNKRHNLSRLVSRKIVLRTGLCLPTSSSCRGLVACSHLEGPFGPSLTSDAKDDSNDSPATWICNTLLCRTQTWLLFRTQTWLLCRTQTWLLCRTQTWLLCRTQTWLLCRTQTWLLCRTQTWLLCRTQTWLLCRTQTWLLCRTHTWLLCRTQEPDTGPGLPSYLDLQHGSNVKKHNRGGKGRREEERDQLGFGDLM